MFCKNCGTQVNDGAAFCPNCGQAPAPAEPTPVAATPVAPAPAPAPAMNFSPAPENNGGNKNMGIIVGGAVGVVALILVIVLLANIFGSSSTKVTKKYVNAETNNEHIALCYGKYDDDKARDLYFENLEDIMKEEYGDDAYDDFMDQMEKDYDTDDIEKAYQAWLEENEEERDEDYEDAYGKGWKKKYEYKDPDDMKNSKIDDAVEDYNDSIDYYIDEYKDNDAYDNEFGDYMIEALESMEIDEDKVKKGETVEVEWEVISDDMDDDKMEELYLEEDGEYEVTCLKIGGKWYITRLATDFSDFEWFVSDVYWNSFD